MRTLVELIEQLHAAEPTPLSPFLRIFSSTERLAEVHPGPRAVVPDTRPVSQDRWRLATPSRFVSKRPIPRPLLAP